MQVQALICGAAISPKELIVFVNGIKHPVVEVLHDVFFFAVLSGPVVNTGLYRKLINRFSTYLLLIKLAYLHLFEIANPILEQRLAS